jgi:hypothetical protein
VDLGPPESGSLDEVLQQHRVCKREGRAPVVRRLQSSMPLQGLYQGSHPRAADDIAPDAHRQPAAGPQDTAHLRQRGNLIRDLLEALLAQHDVTYGIGKRRAHRVGHNPIDWILTDRRHRAGDRKHRGIEVQPGGPP